MSKIEWHFDDLSYENHGDIKIIGTVNNKPVSVIYINDDNTWSTRLFFSNKQPDCEVDCLAQLVCYVECKYIMHMNSNFILRFIKSLIGRILQ